MYTTSTKKTLKMKIAFEDIKEFQSELVSVLMVNVDMKQRVCDKIVRKMKNQMEYILNE